MKKQAGFTLIELVMVIVILGILAAVALPKFVNLSGDARKATLAGADGAMRSAANMAHAAALAAGSSVVTIEGTAYTLVNDYPTAAQIATLAGVSGVAGYTATAAGVVQVTGAGTPANCQISYTAPAAAGAAPSFVVVNSGC